LRGVSLGGPEIEPVQFQKENADHEPGPLVAIDRGMLADDARCVQ